MPLKISREDLERLRKNGATVRSKGGDTVVSFSKDQLDQFRDTAAARRVVPEEEPPPPAPEIDMGAIHDTIHEAVSHAFEQMPGPRAPTYHFEVSRDEKGFIKSVIATPK